MKGATLDELARGIHGAVTRGDAKKMAAMHGHSWKALLKRMKRISRGLTRLEMSLPPPPTALDRHIDRVARGE